MPESVSFIDLLHYSRISIKRPVINSLSSNSEQLPISPNNNTTDHENERNDFYRRNVLMFEEIFSSSTTRMYKEKYRDAGA